MLVKLKSKLGEGGPAAGRWLLRLDELCLKAYTRWGRVDMKDTHRERELIDYKTSMITD